MENQNQRLILSDLIYSKLVRQEHETMKFWQQNESDIKLKEDNLPSIDVLTCVYNAEKYISTSIESIMMQSYPKINLIIVTDPCTDKTIDIIKEYVEKFPNITLIENENHEGIINCFNIGLRYCNNDFIARMDLDDIIHPMRFEKQMEFLKLHSEISVVSCFMQIFNEKFEVRNVSYREDFDYQKITLLFFSPLSHAGSIFRAKILKEIGYRVGYTYAEDYDLWFQIMSKYKTAVLPEYLYLYRTHSNQVTNPKNLNIIKSSYYLIIGNIFKKLGFEYDNETITYHINNIMFKKETLTEIEWIEFHNWFNILIKANRQSNFFNQKKLIEFIYTNYWQTTFNNVSGSIRFSLFVKYLFCEINQKSILHKSKQLLKRIIKIL